MGVLFLKVWRCACLQEVEIVARSPPTYWFHFRLYFARAQISGVHVHPVFCE